MAPADTAPARSRRRWSSGGSTRSERAGRLRLAAAMAVAVLVGCLFPLTASAAAGSRAAPREHRELLAVHRHARPGPTYRNPVIAADAPDPDIVALDGTYYAFTTASLNGPIQLFVSNDLVHWRAAGWPGPLVRDAPWTTYGREWAPSVIEVGDEWLLFYATEQTATGEQCVTAAVAPAINGPYVNDASTPLACNAIDPSPVQLPDGSLALVWKASAADGQAQLVEQPLTSDGTSFAPGTAPVVLLSADQPWESTIENPDLVQIDGSWLLFFSGGDWENASYGTGVARCTGPQGPCTEPYDHPVLSSTSQVIGPGGASAFRDSSGQWWLVYAAASPGKAQYDVFGDLVRSMRIDPVCVTDTSVSVLGPSVDPRPLHGTCSH